MATTDTIRNDLNTGLPGRLASAQQKINFGELISYIVAKLTATESGVTVTTNVATLANTPSAVFQINATAGTTTGVKKLRQGPITGTNALVPATGEAVWDGGKKVLFAAVDAITTASFTYAQTTDLASDTMGTLEVL